MVKLLEKNNHSSHSPSSKPSNAASALLCCFRSKNNGDNSKQEDFLDSNSNSGTYTKQKAHFSTSSSGFVAQKLNSRSSSLDATLQEPGVQVSADMAQIATVHPFNNGANTNPYHSSSTYKFEDVTDDPKYKQQGDDNENREEGSLIEWNRLDKHGSKTSSNNNNRHSVCEANSAVKTRSTSLAGSKLLAPSNWRQSPVQRQQPSSQQQMAHVIDVQVGQPCTAMAHCNCFGFRPHTWRKVCVHCKCDRTEHEIGPNQVLNVYERLGIKPSDTMAAVMTNNNNNNQRTDGVGSVGHGYAWVPPGLSRVKIEEYMAQLPNHVIPRINSIGEKNREKQLMLQLPRQDLSVAYCKHLKTPIERRLYEEFVNSRNEVALDIGYVSVNIPKAMECRKCRGILERNEMAVLAPKLGETAGWHPACFSCATCEQLLVDLTYCVREDKIYCERHYAEMHKPRCSACDELVFAGEYTKAMNKDWHSDHFCCWQCDQTLTGQRYILRDEHPYCIKCYEEIFANTCDECSKHIGIDSKDLSYKDKHWHEDCFLCNMCKISLVDKPFGSKNDRIFCSNCYDQAFATKCDGCNEIFRAGMKRWSTKESNGMTPAFVVHSASHPSAPKVLYQRTKMSTVLLATRTNSRQDVVNVITTGGVTYKNEPWHRECFQCTNCNTSLAGQRFTSKDEKPYCADCYGELFAKRCSACVKPITGIGGAKFISFEDRHWHNDCFICAQCTTTLVGKGFITDGADILCPECAKARLMAANS